MRSPCFIKTLSFLALLFFATGSAFAVDPVQEPAKPLPTTALHLNVNKSTAVGFGTPAATVFIANPEIADVQVVTPTRIMVYGKKQGETTLLVSDDRGRALVDKTVVVSQDLSELERSLRNLAPKEKLGVRAVPNGVLLTGEVADSSVIEAARRIAVRYIPEQNGDIINQIKLRGNDQIQIQVRFAEVARDADKRLGINWENAISSGNFVFGLATGPDFYKGVGEELERTVMGDATNNAFAMGYRDGHSNVQGMVDALVKNGLVTILAEPTLTAMSGETASFLAGGEIPVPVPQDDNISIEWKQYGVSLSFTPTVLNGNRINLHVRPEVSQLTEIGSITLNNIEVPGLLTRRAETTVELASGQSFAIAGLLNSNQTQSIQKFPFLGDIPVIGPIFRSTRFQNNESELVIIITPYIVKPTQTELALPTDGYGNPSDSEMVFEMTDTKRDDAGSILSGHPRAIKVDAPKVEAAPVPQVDSAPASPEPKKEADKGQPVLSATEKNVEPEAVLPPMSTPVSKKKPVLPRPSGPGGFIME